MPFFVIADEATLISGIHPRLEQFKSFMASPPIIEELVFSEKVSPTPGGGIPMDGTFSKSRFFNYYQARYQPNALFFRQMPRPTDVTNHAVLFQFVSHFDNRFWLMDRSSNIDLWMNPGGPLPTNANYVLSTAQFRTRLLREVLLFGVMHLEIGKIRWEGNRFTATSSIEPFAVSGELFATNGVADHLTIRYHYQGRDYHWIARYQYETPLELPFLPSRVSCFWLDDGVGREVQQAEYSILSLSIAGEPLDSDRFDPEPFVAENRWQRRVLTNGMLFSVTPSNELRFIETMPLPGESGSRIASPPNPAVVYSVWAAANFGIFLLGVRVRKSHGKQRNQ